MMFSLTKRKIRGMIIYKRMNEMEAKGWSI